MSRKSDNDRDVSMNIECLCCHTVQVVTFGQVIDALGVNYSARASKLADKCGQLTDENRNLLAENARLRRKLERR